MKADKGCPPVTLNVDAIVDAAKQAVLKECPSIGRGETAVESVNRVSSLGAVRLVEDKVDPMNFVLGFVTIPSAVNFATKLMQVGVILPQVDMAISRGTATGLTLVATLLSGGKSFLLGSLLGQFPSTLDALADVAISAIVSAKGKTYVPPAGQSVKGLGQTPEEELQKLRKDLERLSGLGSEGEQEEMEGMLVVRQR